MNKAILIGNLTRDPEARTTSSGIPMTTFTLAVNRRFTNQQGVREADFIPIITWRQQAELCARYLTKGRKCAVVGTIQTRSYDAQDGTKRYVTEVVADEVEFIGAQSQGGAGGYADNVPPPPEPASFSPKAAAPSFGEADDDELPF
ncbi:single-stranded DNA-binding protein [Bacillota bacterium Meth-B3]|nr:single-stranded DNA-binding protein [Christensenellaceae bacterium]MEA5066674.1 single-stranded DNA-binding protein [Eubacteriales bacterium]MEA5067507.1 single-stranded DNA-binding protein [Christensenellaceae bacterium]